MSVKYKEFTGLNLPAIEQEILRQWSEKQAFEKSVSLREGAPSFVFFEGPPSANGMPGIHHVISRTLKDLVCRYKTMQGFQVKRKGGWDTHGLPIELGVGGRLKLSKRMALTWDYTHVLVGMPETGFYNPLSIGLDIETGGHVFQLHVTNATGMNERAFITETTGQWGKGQVRFGFNLSRTFQLKKPKLD